MHAMRPAHLASVHISNAARLSHAGGEEAQEEGPGQGGRQGGGTSAGTQEQWHPQVLVCCMLPHPDAWRRSKLLKLSISEASHISS